MCRLLRVKFPGALYYVTSRGNRRARIYLDDSDNQAWLNLLGIAAERFQFVVHAYCQMPNHFHLLLETETANISEGMKYLNGTYSQQFNRKYELVGHMFQGRFHSKLIKKQAHLLELARYTALNPVRAKLVDDAADWRWSSHGSLIGLAPTPPWLETAWLLGQFGNGASAERIRAYLEFVAAGAHAAPSATLQGCSDLHGDPDQALVHAYDSAQFSVTAIAAHFKVSRRTVLRIVQASRKTKS